MKTTDLGEALSAALRTHKGTHGLTVAECQERAEALEYAANNATSWEEWWDLSTQADRWWLRGNVLTECVERELAAQIRLEENDR